MAIASRYPTDPALIRILYLHVKRNTLLLEKILIYILHQTLCYANAVQHDIRLEV